jgi:TPR repeat protein
MSSLTDLPELVGFFSYSRDDDEAFQGTLSTLRDAIQRELAAQLGRSKRTFRLWQDQMAIATGQLWESEIKKAVEESVFFIPIVTPRAVNSKYCKFEFELFLAREKALGRDDLVFPILYIPVAMLEDESKWREDLVLSTVGARQYVDWRLLRHLDVQTTAVREKIADFCRQIVEALNRPRLSPEERRMEEAKARQQAEEEQKVRQLEAEAKRRAEEVERQKEAEQEARRRTEEKRKQAERKAREAEARRKATEAAEARSKTEREPPSAQPRPQAPGRLSVTPEQKEQSERVPSERPKGAAVSTTVPWRIIAGTAIILGVIAIVVTVWRPGPPVTLQDASAMKDQGDRYYFGVNASKDNAQAREWYQKAVDNGSVDAMVSLGALYANGQGVAQDYAKAREWYQKAAAKGNADAMYHLGNLYDDGHGVAQDSAKAREWYQKAADKGSVEAMFTLGLHYDYGYGVAQDYAKAREWYEKAADKGDANAKARLQQLPIR